MAPPPADFMSGSTAWAAKNWCLRFTAMRWSKYSGVTLSVACRSSCAALLTSTVIGPNGTDLGDGAAQRLGVGNVGMEVADRRAACRQLTHQVTGGSVGDVDEADLGLLAREGAHDRRADAAAAAGDQHRASFEIGVDRAAGHAVLPAVAAA